MACDHCTLLTARIDRLERELGIRRRDYEIAALVTRLEVTPTHARVLLRLYAAGGKPVSKDSVMQVLTTDSDGALKVNIYQIRQKLGEDFIGTNVTLGYHLTAPGLSRVMAALQPVEMQDVRG